MKWRGGEVRKPFDRHGRLGPLRFLVTDRVPVPNEGSGCGHPEPTANFLFENSLGFPQRSSGGRDENIWISRHSESPAKRDLRFAPTNFHTPKGILSATI